MKLTFASWNTSWKRGMTPAKIAYINARPWNLLALQEVTTPGYGALVAGLSSYRWSAFSLDLVPPIPGNRATDLGCAIFARVKPPDLKFLSARVLRKTPMPWRTLTVQLASASGPLLSVASFHVPDWAGWGEAKPEMQRRIARWMGKHPQQAVVGMDANGPMIDHPNADPIHSKYYFAEEWDLLCPNQTHNLRDVLRADLLRKGALAAVPPTGPLAVSHKQGGKGFRYDHVYATPDFDVLAVDYDYAGAVAAGGDHAFITADLDLVGY